jgi:DNA-binding IclR family transcriptional regulator
MEATTVRLPRAPTSTRAVERALALLNAVARGEGRGRLCELARATDVPASTALRLLRTLERQDYVRREADGCFRPGAGLLELARAAAPHDQPGTPEPGGCALEARSGPQAHNPVRTSS